MIPARLSAATRRARAAGAVLLAIALSAAPGRAEEWSAPDGPVVISLTLGAVSDGSSHPVPAVRIGRALDFEGAPIHRLQPPPSLGGGAQTGGRVPGFSPLRQARLTSQFGMRSHPILAGRRFHAGIDLAAPQGSAVFATSGGIVSRAAWQGGYGLTIAVEHSGGVQTRYAHLSRIAVVPGQSVATGEVIGYVGSTGRSTGPHLHYEVRRNGQVLNPRLQ